jgi:lysophospholipase L1-like esterase
MLDRRNFLMTGAIAAGAATLGGTGRAEAAAANPAGVGGYNYRLPRLPSGTRLVFQGDSITDMNWGRNEGDRNHYLGHSYVYLIAARLGVDCAADKLEFFNRGASGNGISNLKERWQKDAVDMKPDLLSILIGVNDVNRMLQGLKAKDWEADYHAILDASRKANPGLKLVLLDPFVLASGNLAKPDEFRKWRGQIDLMLPVVGKLAKEFDAVHIKTQEVFDAACKALSPGQWIWDGIHPLPQGHELIARNWLEQVSARWNRA